MFCSCSVHVLFSRRSASTFTSPTASATTGGATGGIFANISLVPSGDGNNNNSLTTASTVGLVGFQGFGSSQNGSSGSGASMDLGTGLQFPSFATPSADALVTTTSAAPSSLGTVESSSSSHENNMKQIDILNAKKRQFTNEYVNYMIKQPPRVVEHGAIARFMCTYAYLDRQLKDLTNNNGKLPPPEAAKDSVSVTTSVTAPGPAPPTVTTTAPPAVTTTTAPPSAGIAQSQPPALFGRTTGFQGFSAPTEGRVVASSAVDDSEAQHNDVEDTTQEDDNDGVAASADAADWNVLYTVEANFLKMAGKGWKSCCISELKLERRFDDPNVRRMIMRAQGVGKVVLNVPIVKGMPFREGQAKKDGTRRTIMFVGKNWTEENPPEETFRLSVAAASFESLQQQLLSLAS